MTLKSLAKLIVSLADLLEAEGRALRDNAFRLAVAIVLLALAGCAVLVALALVSLGMFLGLQSALGSAWAAALTALLPLLIAGALLWTALLLRR